MLGLQLGISFISMDTVGTQSHAIPPLDGFSPCREDEGKILSQEVLA